MHAVVNVFRFLRTLSVIEASERYRQMERRHNYATPKSYLELISFYHNLLQQKRGELDQTKGRLERGLAILKQTTVDVNNLKEDLQKRLLQVPWRFHSCLAGAPQKCMVSLFSLSHT